MTVENLIKYLQTLDPNMKVVTGMLEVIRKSLDDPKLEKVLLL